MYARRASDDDGPEAPAGPAHKHAPVVNSMRAADIGLPQLESKQRKLNVPELKPSRTSPGKPAPGSPGVASVSLVLG